MSPKVNNFINEAIYNHQGNHAYTSSFPKAFCFIGADFISHQKNKSLVPYLSFFFLFEKKHYSFFKIPWAEPFSALDKAFLEQVNRWIKILHLQPRLWKQLHHMGRGGSLSRAAGRLCTCGRQKEGPIMKANGRLTSSPHFYVLPRASSPSGGVFLFSLSLFFFFCSLNNFIFNWLTMLC